MSSTQSFHTPVLFLVFNRLEPTKQVFQAIREAKPPLLYIASDGPRINKAGEDDKVKAIREYVVENVDWDCKIHTLFREKNLGCKDAVDSAVKWFFSLEEQGIVLEDDCLPSGRFFYFCQEMLEKFKDNMNIAAIGGRNELETYSTGENGFFFSRKFFAWGWASWASRIEFADANLGYGAAGLNFIRSLPFAEKLMVKSYVKALQSNAVNTWDWPYDLSFRKNKMYTLLPSKNLIKNIGFGEDATHTTVEAIDRVGWYHELEVNLDDSPKISPSEKFMKCFIKKRYKSSFDLFVAVNIDKLKPLIKLYKLIR